ncbi:MAG: hypothetical protein ACLTMW_07600 [Blautia hydrogenotrophica]
MTLTVVPIRQQRKTAPLMAAKVTLPGRQVMGTEITRMAIWDGSYEDGSYGMEVTRMAAMGTEVTRMAAMGTEVEDGSYGDGVPGMAMGMKLRGWQL